jgi:hypothetical protein
MSLEIKGKIEKFLDVKTFPKKDKPNENWVTQDYLVRTSDEYNNLYCLNVFGDENVEKLTKYNKVGDSVKVQFNVNCREVEGKYYTALSSWRIEKDTNLDTNQHFETVDDVKDNEKDDLPFN